MSQPRLPDSIVQPIAMMPLSRMENTTFVMPSIMDFHNMGLRTVLQSRYPKRNAYSANQPRPPVLSSFALCRNFLLKNPFSVVSSIEKTHKKRRMTCPGSRVDDEAALT
ncbi:hypothetical protein TNCV_576031 [Trichonephila clavipes]|nr:hypothetical protein TNCV_576031 [Trichonephila clavipes]